MYRLFLNDISYKTFSITNYQNNFKRNKPKWFTSSGLKSNLSSFHRFDSSSVIPPLSRKYCDNS